MKTRSPASSYRASGVIRDKTPEGRDKFVSAASSPKSLRFRKECVRLRTEIYAGKREVKPSLP